jgi:hypothetical protein
VAVKGGVPLSLTWTVMMFVVPPCSQAGIHENTALVAERLRIRAPVGADNRLKSNCSPGNTKSRAKLVRTSARFASTT